MKIVKTKIKGLVLIKTKIHADRRGFFKEVEKNNVTKKNSSLIVFHFQKKILLEDFIYRKKKARQK